MAACDTVTSQENLRRVLE